MGFELQYQRVIFGPGDGRYEGLEVVLNELSIGALTMIEGLADDDTDKRNRSLEVMVRLLGEGQLDADPPILRGIRSWNYSRNGEPVPVSVAELHGLGLGVVVKLIGEWQEQATVAAPLERRSSGGAPSVEVSIPMETPSLSPETLRRLASTEVSSRVTPPTLSAHFAENPLP